MASGDVLIAPDFAYTLGIPNETENNYHRSHDFTERAKALWCKPDFLKECCFTPPIFAAYCSANGKECIDRLARYKKLIGPMFYDLSSDGNQLTLKLDSIDGHELSGTFAVGEFLFLVNLIRKATKEQIRPVSVMVTLENPAPEYSDGQPFFCNSCSKASIRSSICEMILRFPEPE